MKISYLFYFLLFVSISTYSQIPIEYNHSPNGKPIIGNYHSYLNGEFASVEINLERESSTFEKGVFVLNNTDKINKTYINYLNNRISTKADILSYSKIKRYKADEIKYFKLGIDSFFVADKIKIKENLINKATLIKYVATLGNKIYAQYYEYNPVGGTLKNKFFIQRSENSDIWEQVKLEGEPVRKFLMNHNKFIDKKELTEEEFLNSIKEKQFFDKLESQKSICYDKSWQEIYNESNSKYKAKVTSKKDSIYTLDYFNDKEEKIYQVSYSSLNPVKKTGEMSIFSNDKLVSKRLYSNDSLLNTTYFYPNGNIKIKSENKFIKNEFNKEEQKTFYLNMIDDSNSDFVETGKGEMAFETLQINYELNKDKLKKAYYLEDNKEVNFFVKKDKVIKTSTFKTLLENYLFASTSYRKARLAMNLEGTILVDVTTDYKGRVVDYKILNLLNNKMDYLIEQFCKTKILGKIKYRFKGIKLENKNALCRFVLPISFSHKRFHRTFTRPNYDFHHHWMFQQQMMFQQQQMMRAPGF